MAGNFISALKSEVAALESELEQTPTYRRLLRARALLAEYQAGSSASEAATRDVDAVAKSTAPEPTVQDKAVPPKRQRHESTQTILNAVVKLLRGSDEPMRTSRILVMLREMGHEIPGEKALNNLSAIISYSKMFQAHGRSGWTLLKADAAATNTEAVSNPNLARRMLTASAEHRPTSGGTLGMPVEPVQGGGT